MYFIKASIRNALLMAHTACGKNNFVLDVEVTAGNIHDRIAFNPLYDKLCEHYSKYQIIVADSTYKTSWICKRIFDSRQILSTAINVR